MSFSLDAYIDELRPLVNVDCGSFTVEGIEVVANLMAQKYVDLGWHVKRIDCGIAGTGLEVRNKPEVDHIDVLLIGHMDTVFPVGTAAERPLKIENGRAYGPGANDMKGGLLNIIYALRGLDKAILDKLSICVCMNPDEEIGSLHSAPWLTSVALKSKCALIAEPGHPNDTLVKARKGMARYTATFHGKAAHAGTSLEQGRSAVTEMAHWIIAINAMTDFEIGSTLNVGLVKGGIGANVVPDFAEITIDFRFWKDEAFEDVDKKLHDLSKKPFVDGVTVQLKRDQKKFSMQPTEATEALMAIIDEAGKDVGMNINWASLGGMSDANLTANLGIPSLDAFGPCGAGSHSVGEYLDLTTVELRMRLLQKVLTRLAG